MVFKKEIVSQKENKPTVQKKTASKKNSQEELVMHKTDLMKQIAEYMHNKISANQVKEVVDAFFHILGTNLAEGKKINWVGFLIAFSREQKALVRNPNSKDDTKIKPKYGRTIRLKPGITLKNIVNGIHTE